MNAKDDSQLAMYRTVVAVLTAASKQISHLPTLVSKVRILQIKIDRLFDLASTPALSDSRNAGTKELEPTMLEIDYLQEREIDPLLLGFKTSDPQFYRDYCAARIV